MKVIADVNGVKVGRLHDGRYQAMVEGRSPVGVRTVWVDFSAAEMNEFVNALAMEMVGMNGEENVT